MRSTKKDRVLNDPMGPEDVRLAATICREALSDVVNLDWSVGAGELEWSCRRTLEHISNAPIDYASELALPAKESLERIYPSVGRDHLTIPDLLLLAEVNAAILDHVIRAAPASAQAFHHAWMVDLSGFAGMACDEILIHTADIAAGFEIDFKPPEDFSSRVLARLFPWAPTDVGHWDSLLWANGRIALPELGLAQDKNWRWHCAPLSEWDGRIPRRGVR